MRSGRYKTLFLTSLMLPKLIAANGCSGNVPPDPANLNMPDTFPAASAVEMAADTMTYEYIMEAIYYNKRVPEYFYHEASPPDDVFQTIQHVKNIDIASARIVYELCTDSADEALQWSETAKRNLGDLVEITDTDLYFQFDRVPLTQPHFKNLQRIYKCAMLDRSLVDLNAPDEHLGFYYGLPPQSEGVRKIIEYLWTFSVLNNYGNAVLKGVMEETVSGFEYALYQARLVADLNGDCDTINIYRTLYSTDKNSGNISYNETLIDSLQTKFENIPAFCN